jgi:hypothetical protein
MTACERHKRAVVVFEIGLGDCPLCQALDKLAAAEAECDDLRSTAKDVERIAADAEEKLGPR